MFFFHLATTGGTPVRLPCALFSLFFFDVGRCPLYWAAGFVWRSEKKPKCQPAAARNLTAEKRKTNTNASQPATQRAEGKKSKLLQRQLPANSKRGQKKKEEEKTGWVTVLTRALNARVRPPLC